MTPLKTSYLSRGDVHLVYGDSDPPSVRTSRQSLRNALQEFGFNVMCSKGPSAFLDEMKLSSPSVLLLDTRFKDCSGIALQAKLIQLGLQCSIIFLGGNTSAKEVVMALKQGALDFLAQPFTFQEICVVIEKAMTHNVDIAARQAYMDALKLRLKLLTRRERDVCLLMVRGYGNIEIAAISCCSASTVKIHRHRILIKMGAKSLACLVTQMCCQDRFLEN